MNDPTTTHLRTNESLNLSVLRRHNPSITSIISLASFAVIYTFSSASQTWEKAGIEGTLFVVALAASSSSPSSDTYASTGEERYGIIVLNRRGLNNFEMELGRREDVDVEEGFIIVKGRAGAENEDGGAGGASTGGLDGAMETSNAAAAAALAGSKQAAAAYGLWIYEQSHAGANVRELMAGLILDCAARAEESRREVVGERAGGGLGDDRFGGLVGGERDYDAPAMSGDGHEFGSQGLLRRVDAQEYDYGYGRGGGMPAYEARAGFQDEERQGPTSYAPQAYMQQQPRQGTQVQQSQPDLLLNLFRNARGSGSSRM